ncbi:S41 family peptidase [Patescibacteria group bacterium]|nr:S41 family peptidase [Patescibacteria group bacterium]
MKLPLKTLRTGVVILSLTLLSGWFGFRLGQSHGGQPNLKFWVSRAQPVDKQTIDLSLFWQVWDKLGESYLDKTKLDPQAMVYGAIRGMTAALGDPYTVFLTPETNKESKEELDGAFEGVGIQLGFKNNQLAVIAPLEGMPAKAAGILAGDLILHIKDDNKKIDQDTLDLSLPEAVKLIRGEKGTSIELTVLHQDVPEPEAIMIKRDTIVVKSVELVWVGEAETVAHLKLTRFGGRTEAEWQEAVQAIVKRRPQGIILDLRNNPGGYLQGAIDLAGEFLPVGKLVVKQESASGQVETYSVDRSGQLLTQPLVILVNQGSASSSEILAGALKDNGRAQLVGEQTFGKGTVQEALDVGNGAGLHVTTAKWLLPLGAWVNETKGLTPDVEVKDDPETEADEQLARALELL